MKREISIHVTVSGTASLEQIGKAIRELLSGSKPQYDFKFLDEDDDELVSCYDLSNEEGF